MANYRRGRAWMPSIAFLFYVISLVPSGVRAELFLYDGFDYAPGEAALTGADGGIGWDGSWDIARGNRREVDVEVDSLSYIDSAGNELQTSGNQVGFIAVDTSTQNVRLIDMASVPASLVEDGRLGKDGTSVWLSFLMRSEGDPDPIWGGVSLFDGEFSGGQNTTNRIDFGYKNDDRLSPTFGMGFPGRPDPWADRSDVDLDEQSFLLARIDFNELVDPDTNEGEDEIFMWVNPRLDSEPDDNDALFLPFRRNESADDQDATFMFDRIRIEIGQGDEGVMDELRFGETFADVTPTTRIPGDFDGSGVFDLPDVNMLSTEIAAATNDVTFDLNADNLVNNSDLTIWVKDLRKTWFGDADLDGEFASGDLIIVLAAGKFESDQVAGWQEGDWDANLRFTTGDLVKALADGGFGQGALPAATSAVPEPSSSLILTLLSLGLMLYRRSKYGPRS